MKDTGNKFNLHTNLLENLKCEKILRKIWKLSEENFTALREKKIAEI